MHPHHPLVAAALLGVAAVLAAWVGVAVQLGLSLQTAWALTPILVALILSLKGSGRYWHVLGLVVGGYGLLYLRLPDARLVLAPLAIAAELLTAAVFLFAHHIDRGRKPARKRF
jgi:hypothetical protein